MASTPRSHVRVALGLVALIPLLAACSTSEPAEETSTPQAPTTSESAETLSSSSTSSSSLSSEPEVSVTSSEDPEETDAMAKDVAAVYEVFHSLAPLSLFEQFDTCDPNGVENASACTGPEVGQFQFFDNASKAASTTQLLTELRSSRVVEDTGSKVVGWTTIGTMSILTVVDNDQGLVLQQMVSSDKIDPEELIYELGLAAENGAEPTAGGDNEAETESATGEPTPTTTTKN